MSSVSMMNDITDDALCACENGRNLKAIFIIPCCRVQSDYDIKSKKA